MSIFDVEFQTESISVVLGNILLVRRCVGFSFMVEAMREIGGVRCVSLNYPPKLSLVMQRSPLSYNHLLTFG